MSQPWEASPRQKNKFKDRPGGRTATVVMLVAFVWIGVMMTGVETYRTTRRGIKKVTGLCKRSKR
jgi:hypothetical protein